MQLVIRVDLDKADRPLPEIFKLIGDCGATAEAEEGATAGSAMPIRDHRSVVIGEWDLEEAEDGRHPLESPYRAAATARYGQPGQIEVDRFATVSLTDDGAYVQGWLFVPQSDVAAETQESASMRKPPQSVYPGNNAGIKAG
jgi:hypothetical protein